MRRHTWVPPYKVFLQGRARVPCRGVRENLARADVGIGPYGSIIDGAVGQATVRVGPAVCGKYRGINTGTGCHSQCAHWLRNDIAQGSRRLAAKNRTGGALPRLCA